MRKYNIRVVLLFLLIFIAIQPGYSQKVGTTSFQFLKVCPDAKATSMGGAVAAIGNDSRAVFYNPAGLAEFTGNMDLSVSYVDWFIDVSLSSFSAAYRLPSNMGMLGAQALFVNYGEIKETVVSELGMNPDGTYNPGLTGATITPNAMVAGLSYARQMSSQFSFGLTAKVGREDLIKENTTIIMFDGGLIYKTGFRSLKIGASLQHFGPNVTFVEDKDMVLFGDSTAVKGESFPLPQAFSVGISQYLIGANNPLLLNSSNHEVLVSLDMVHPRDYEQQYNLGIEYSLNDILFLRGGYRMNYDTAGLTFGLGVSISMFDVDYSFNDFGEYLDQVHRFTIGFKLGQ